MSQGFLSVIEHQRLSRFPDDMPAGDIGRYYTLSNQDLEEIGKQRGSHNRLGFALQLCTLRYLGFIPDDLLAPPVSIISWLTSQLGGSVEDLHLYGQRDQTRSDHLSHILTYTGFQRSTSAHLEELESWLVERALEHDHSSFLLRSGAERLRWQQILRPGLSVLERIVSAARVKARQITFERLKPLLIDTTKTFLDQLLVVEPDHFRTPLTWLQRMPNDHTASQILETLEKISYLKKAGVGSWNLSQVNPNRLKQLANIGAKATNQQLLRSSDMRRYSILIAFIKQALFEMTDVVVDLFNQCLWEIHVDAKNDLNKMRLRAARSTNNKLRSYNQIIRIVINKEIPDKAVRKRIFDLYDSQYLQKDAEETEQLIRPQQDEAIDLFANRYSYIRRFAPAFLSTLHFQSRTEAHPLLEGIDILRELNSSSKRAIPSNAPVKFIHSAWEEYVIEPDEKINRRYYELALLWELRSALRSSDIFVQYARRHSDSQTYLIPADIWPDQRPEVVRLTYTPLKGETRVKERATEMKILAEKVEKLLTDKQSWLRIENGKWVLTPLGEEDKPHSAKALEEAIAERLPRLDIPDLLIEVDQWTGFSSCFTHVAEGKENPDPNGLKYLYANILAQGANFSLAQMSRTSGFPHHQLVYTGTWFVHEQALKKANTQLVNYHFGLEISHLWGAGTFSSSDGQRFPISGKNRKARAILRDFGYKPGITFYSWSSDQLSLYGGKAIVSTIRDATYVLDEILANETELPIFEHTTDTDGYSEIVFALFDLLGLSFTPRIKGLKNLQLYRLDSIDLNDLPLVRARLSKQINTERIYNMWDEMLRFVGSLKLGWVTASLAIQKLQASARKSELAKAFQEYGRLIKTIHVLGWYESEEKRRWANRQLNKGEALHGLKAYLSIGNRGVLRRKTDENLQHQVGCLNLLTNVIILWNSVYMWEALKQLKQEGYPVNEEDLKHIWPTRFEHLNIFGKFEFDLENNQQRKGLRKLRNRLDPNP